MNVEGRVSVLFMNQFMIATGAVRSVRGDRHSSA